MLEATGAEGAAKASISQSDQTQNNNNIIITKTINPNPKLQDESISSFEKWKTQLLNNII
jgi:hypothetical protein